MFEQVSILKFKLPFHRRNQGCQTQGFKEIDGQLEKKIHKMVKLYTFVSQSKSNQSTFSIFVISWMPGWTSTGAIVLKDSEICQL